MYNILASFSDLTNPSLQYSIYVENIVYTDFMNLASLPENEL